MDKFPCPLTEADWQYLKECAARCDQRAPVIDAFDQLGIETGQLRSQNEAQKTFCLTCEQLRLAGIF